MNQTHFQRLDRKTAGSFQAFLFCLLPYRLTTGLVQKIMTFPRQTLHRAHKYSVLNTVGVWNNSCFHKAVLFHQLDMQIDLILIISKTIES